MINVVFDFFNMNKYKILIIFDYFFLDIYYIFNVKEIFLIFFKFEKFFEDFF